MLDDPDENLAVCCNCDDFYYEHVHANDVVKCLWEPTEFQYYACGYCQQLIRDDDIRFIQYEKKHIYHRLCYVDFYNKLHVETYGATSELRLDIYNDDDIKEEIVRRWPSRD